ncbi:MAG: N-acetyltransferase [Maribacter sp.]|nr:N-acetyltransferase [Maribacter sp.]
MEIEQLALIDNVERKRYEMHFDGFVPRIEYIQAQDKIYLTHTEVPKELEGKGLAATLTRKVLEDIENKNLTLVPLCPYVAQYIKRHPEWKKLI